MGLGATVCTPRGAVRRLPRGVARAIRLCKARPRRRAPLPRQGREEAAEGAIVCVVVANSTSGSGGSSSERCPSCSGRRRAPRRPVGFPSVEVEVEAEGAAAGSPSKVPDAAARLSALLSQDLGCGDGVVWELEREMANSGVTDGSNDYDVDEDAKSEAPAVAGVLVVIVFRLAPCSPSAACAARCSPLSRQRHTMHIVVCRLSGGGDGGGDRRPRSLERIAPRAGWTNSK